MKSLSYSIIIMISVFSNCCTQELEKDINQTGRFLMGEISPLSKSNEWLYNTSVGSIGLYFGGNIESIKGDTIGLHFISNGMYAVAVIEHDTMVYVRENPSMDGLRCSASLLIPANSPDISPSDFGSVVAWLPTDSIYPSQQEYHPSKFFSTKQLLRKEANDLSPKEILLSLNDLLIDKKLLPISEQGKIEIVCSFPGDVDGNIDVYGIKAIIDTTLTNSWYSISLYAQRNNDQLNLIILGIEENKPEYLKYDDDYKSIVRPVGVVDLDFDGIYEIIHYYYWGGSSTAYSATYGIIQVKNGKIIDIGQSISYSGC